MNEKLMDIRNRVMALSMELGTSRTPRKEVFLSIVIPAYNEVDRLPRTLVETVRWCHANVPDHEIIVADDGSSDDTLDTARIFSEFFPNVKAIACSHLGKGSAVRAGMLNASGGIVMFMDADGATPLEETAKLLRKMEEGYGVVIGSRVPQIRGETVVTTPFHRKIIGRIFAFLVDAFAVPGIADTQCGFKMFRKDVVRALFGRQKFDGFAFDVEILFLARRLSIPVAEVSVNWTNQEGSKIRLATDSVKMLKDIVRIRYLHARSKGEAVSSSVVPPVFRAEPLGRDPSRSINGKN